MDAQWRQGDDAESFRSKLSFLKPPTGEVMEQLREMKEKVSKETAELRISQEI